MSRRRLEEDPEDDGRVIADMSGVERPSLLGHMHRLVGTGAERKKPERKVWAELTVKQRIWMALGALKAGCAVSMIYVVFLAVVVLVLLAVWGG
ncbi:hypothetical protein [Olsenella profusa]|uniref:Uncharacterized protein n=1 Tax=Olsenella profusa TaxID=138595 RepID=A0ABS2F3G9_9ACTN|nr:hypothetical protein [Olsenella profusa]MBM6775084.1 hypothetical protein [Olsenella profusa]